MINMKKHSSAESLSGLDEGNQLKVQYTDDGVGFPTDFRYANGLTNTENRIRCCRRIIFDRNTPTE